MGKCVERYEKMNAVLDRLLANPEVARRTMKKDEICFCPTGKSKDDAVASLTEQEGNGFSIVFFRDGNVSFCSSALNPNGEGDVAFPCYTLSEMMLISQTAAEIKGIFA